MHIGRGTASALAAVLALSGCADSDPLGPPPAETPTPLPIVTATPTPTPTPFPSTGPLSVTQARRLAGLGVLTAADLPGWTESARIVDPTDDEADQAIKECLRLPVQPYLAQDTGRTFTQGGVQVNSKVDVTASLAQADAELTARQGPDGARCYREYLSSPGGGQLTLEVLPVTVLGADRVVAYRLALSGTGPTGPVAAGGYQLLAQAGQVEIALDTFERTATPTFSLERLADLAEIAVARVKGTATPTATSTPTTTATPVRSATATPSPSP